MAGLWSHMQPSNVNEHRGYAGYPYQEHNYFIPPFSGKESRLLSNDQMLSNIEPPQQFLRYHNNPVSSHNEKNDCEDDAPITRCICDFQHDDGYMIACDRCSVWQHVACVDVDRDHMPDVFYCEICCPRYINKHKAIQIQITKRDEAYRAMEDSSGTETENETRYGSRKSPDAADGDAKLSPPGKRHNSFSDSSEGYPSKKQLTRGQRNEKLKKSWRISKKIGFTNEKQLKNKKRFETLPVSKNMVSNNINNMEHSDESCNGLHHILEAISQNEYLQKEQSTTPAFIPLSNTYTPELQKLLLNIKYNNQDNLTSLMASDLDRFNRNLCRIAKLNEDDSKKMVLEATEDILTNFPVAEYVGKVMLRDQYLESWQPNVLFYSKFGGVDLCVDATLSGSEARFVRRSCTPNAEIRHYLQGNSLRFYLHATKSIVQGAEITIGFDFNYHKCGFRVECACTRISCPVARFQRKENNNHIKRSHVTRRTKLNHSESYGETKSTTSAHLSVTNNNNNSNDMNGFSSSTSSPTEASAKKLLRSSTVTANPGLHSKKSSGSIPSALRNNRAHSASDQPRHASSSKVSEVGANVHEEKENSRKKTREEKKIEAIMKTFENMQKTEQKRKEAASSKQRNKKETRKSSENSQKVDDDNNSDLVADAAAVLASLSRNVDARNTNISSGTSDDLQHHVQSENSRSEISQGARDVEFATTVATSIHNNNQTNSNTSQMTYSYYSNNSNPPSSLCITQQSTLISEQNNFSSKINRESIPSSKHFQTSLPNEPTDMCLDAATVLSLMLSSPMVRPSSSSVMTPTQPSSPLVTSTPFNDLLSAAVVPSVERTNSSLHHESASLLSDHESKSCSAKKRWLSRAMFTNQSSPSETGFVTPPKKRRVARESLTSEENNSGIETETFNSKSSSDSKPPLPSTYEPMYETISDDETEPSQTGGPVYNGGPYCIPPGVVLSSLQTIPNSGFYRVQQSVHSASQSYLDSYRFLSNLNFFQNTSSRLAGSGSVSCSSNSVSKDPLVHLIQNNFNGASHLSSPPQLSPPEHSPLAPQNSTQLQKIQPSLDSYLPFINPLNLFPSVGQFPMALSPLQASMQPAFNCSRNGGFTNFVGHNTAEMFRSDMNTPVENRGHANYSEEADFASRSTGCDGKARPFNEISTSPVSPVSTPANSSRDSIYEFANNITPSRHTHHPRIEV